MTKDTVKTAAQNLTRTLQNLKGICSNGEYTLLLVDDDPTFCLLWQRLLEMRGKSFADAHTIGEAKKFIEEHGIDAIEKVLISFDLGVENGMDFLEWLVELSPQMSVMMISGSKETVDKSHEFDPTINFCHKDDTDVIRAFLGIQE